MVREYHCRFLEIVLPQVLDFRIIVFLLLLVKREVTRFSKSFDRPVARPVGGRVARKRD